MKIEIVTLVTVVSPQFAMERNADLLEMATLQKQRLGEFLSAGYEMHQIIPYALDGAAWLTFVLLLDDRAVAKGTEVSGWGQYPVTETMTSSGYAEAIGKSLPKVGE